MGAQGNFDFGGNPWDWFAGGGGASPAYEETDEQRTAREARESRERAAKAEREAKAKADRERREQERREQQERDRREWNGWRSQQGRGWEDPYIVLGLQPNATMDEIKKAHRRLVQKYHPDHGGDAEMFMRVQRAYERLRQK